MTIFFVKNINIIGKLKFCLCQWKNKQIGRSWKIDLTFTPKRNKTVQKINKTVDPAFRLDAFPLDGETRFFHLFGENLIFRKRLGVATYLIFF